MEQAYSVVHYKTDRDHLELRCNAGHFVDPSGLLTDEQLADLESGNHIRFDVDGTTVEMWIA